MISNTSVHAAQDFFRFITVEHEPLMNSRQSMTIVTLSSIFLVVGVLLNGRIFTLLTNRNNGVIIDKLFLSDAIIRGIGHPLVLSYYISSNILFPMSDYIGSVGCLIMIHFLDVFMRFYNFCFPVTIALLRYLFVVQNLWVRSRGMTQVVNMVIFFSVFFPTLMALSVQFPIFDQVHIAFNRCVGRFETYFNPFHPDAITPGVRQGETYCFSTSKWVAEAQAGTLEFYFRFAWLFSCKTTILTTQIVMLGLPEMVLYSATFWHIMQDNQKTALSGIISQDAIKRRKQQNRLNIVITFWSWLAQLITNIIYMLLMSVYFGKVRFYHILLSICTACLNFNIIPLFYIVMSDNDFKAAIQKKDFTLILKLFLGISSV